MDGEKQIAWVEVIDEEAATGDLADAYDAVRGSDGHVENLYLAMSQTPAAIRPADAHYLAVLHNPDNPLQPWLAELVATYVAVLCGSPYAATNHGDNVRHYHPDADEARRLVAALEGGGWDGPETDDATRAALRYTRKLSLDPGAMSEADIAALRQAGFDDKAISYIVQIAASFAYWARITNGLGIRLGDTIGLAGAPAPQRD
ncbi:MAG: peroxidase-related enzyme [Rhodobacteraceae bacterium]|nr:peroxidase-related enzyme [Paracoccaceae bacterium]